MSSRQAVPPIDKGVAVALASSFFGFYAHSGFMSALHNAGIFPGQVAGTSSGAVTAAICGLGYRGEQVENFVLQPGMRHSFWDWYAPLRFPGVASSLYSSGILSGDNAVAYFRSLFKGARLEDFDAPSVQIAVTNMTRRESRIIREGDAAEWVIASCSIPGLFCNRIIDGERWCDGGVALHVPFEHWLDDPEVHTIIIHNIEHAAGTELVMQWPTLSSGFAACHETITKETNALRLKLAKASGKRIIKVDTETAHPKLFPHKQRTRLIEAGRDSGKKTAEMLNQVTV